MSVYFDASPECSAAGHMLARYAAVAALEATHETVKDTEHAHADGLKASWEMDEDGPCDDSLSPSTDGAVAEPSSIPPSTRRVTTSHHPQFASIVPFHDRKKVQSKRNMTRDPAPRWCKQKPRRLCHGHGLVNRKRPRAANSPHRRRITIEMTTHWGKKKKIKRPRAVPTRRGRCHGQHVACRGGGRMPSLSLFPMQEGRRKRPCDGLYP
ncbi:hypothetical protein LX36DRAFT_279255 [Colletotrichum falcatum]|nr:hypothetical protein LX36DRAFT_279255 [Colletotrichum falcatum]